MGRRATARPDRRAGLRGIRAPGLSYEDGFRHLVFTVVDTYAEGWKAPPNHLTTSPSNEGPHADFAYATFREGHE
ncbi:hypothetical protein AB0I77_47690 [Streptomyces sp. NPDC050619]|uniref:hypothetical protein n=1 Tax=Streptomyces sp. NPDC050619 TaxID=3157214 RepID=UPI00343B4D9E